MTVEPDDLMKAARAARKRAYCPYSRFSVGAAAQTRDGRVFAGCNVENASYGLTICAERVALFNAVSADARDIVRVAVSCQKKAGQSPETLMPCGACRQVLAEFMRSDGEVLVDGVGVFTVAALLPQPFQLDRAAGRSKRGNA